LYLVNNSTGTLNTTTNVYKNTVRDCRPTACGWLVAHCCASRGTQTGVPLGTNGAAVPDIYSATGFPQVMAIDDNSRAPVLQGLVCFLSLPCAWFMCLTTRSVARS
jgi:hypothetical protein